jgi:hypothetical protein
MNVNSSEILMVFIFAFLDIVYKEISESVLDLEKKPERQGLQAWDYQPQQMQSSPIAHL